MRTDAPRSTTRTAGDATLGRIVVGIDDTPESVVATAQAGLLRPPGAELVLVAVAERHLAAHAGMAAADAEGHVIAQTSEDLRRAQELVDADDVVLATGRLVDVLADECGRRGATLVAVGTRPQGRLSALAFGGHDVEALERVSCSLLIARPGWGPHRPERVVVAVDGSAEGRAAEAAARALAARIGSELLPVVGLADHGDPALLRAERADALLHPGTLVEAIGEVAGVACLVVCARGGPRNGSLARRLVHRVRCSVLAVRHEPARA